MVRYTSQQQLSIEEFKTPFQIKLDQNNRWVKLAHLIPWDELASIYHTTLNATHGAPALDARIVIGATIIKHKQKLDDREAIEYIRENPYVQYFLGLSNYTSEPVFDRSLFTHLRYRLGADKFDEMNVVIIQKALSIPVSDQAADREKSPGQSTSQNSLPKEDSLSEESSPQTSSPVPPADTAKHRGTLKIDATVADQMIVYPTDLNLLNESRVQSERLIDILYEQGEWASKPRTYRRTARKQYLQMAKKKRKSKRALHKAIGQQLRYLRRNLKTIDGMLDTFAEKPFPFLPRDQRIYWVIQHIYMQQEAMWRSKTHRCDDRIVNIYQPYVRPIVRGKDKANVEFGAKLGVSLQQGYARINTLSWDAYNENSDLIQQVEAYRAAQGYYPEAVIADTIYGSRANRAWLKEHHIRFVGKALGRPSQKSQSAYQKRKRRKEMASRNEIEGKFGQGKNGYNLNKIRARRQKTSESWIAAIFFVMNLIKFSKDFLCLVLKQWLGGTALQSYQRPNHRIGWAVQPWNPSPAALA